jgi:hypothetical protein
LPESGLWLLRSHFLEMAPARWGGQSHDLQPSLTLH